MELALPKRHPPQLVLTEIKSRCGVPGVVRRVSVCELELRRRGFVNRSTASFSPHEPGFGSHFNPHGVGGITPSSRPSGPCARARSYCAPSEGSGDAVRMAPRLPRLRSRANSLFLDASGGIQ
jgi:hypothetical protein